MSYSPQNPTLWPGQSLSSPETQPWTRALSCIRTHADSEKSCSEALRFAQPCWPSARISFCERRAEIPEVLQFFREIFAQILRDLGARRALFRI